MLTPIWFNRRKSTVAQNIFEVRIAQVFIKKVCTVLRLQGEIKVTITQKCSLMNSKCIDMSLLKNSSSFLNPSITEQSQLSGENKMILFSNNCYF